MPRTVVRIGPADHGRPMTLDEFDSAEGREGHLYELGRGVVTVVDVPGFAHGAMVDSIRQQLSVYRAAHPQRIVALLSGGECKILLADLDSERHPDLAIYRSLPEEDGNWATWTPDIVVEVVSPSSRNRDYEEKPEEYLRFGVREYWIVDDERQAVTIRRRVSGRWVVRVVRPPETYKPRLLPGFGLDIRAVFEAARALRG